MPLSLKEILNACTLIAKENIIGEVVCPGCGERFLWIRHGHYTRYLFTGEETITVQRYLCRNRECPRQTFSILPFPLLPILRVTLCFLLAMASRAEESGEDIATLARASNQGWGVARRALGTAGRVRRWLKREYPSVSCCSLRPCRSCQGEWSGFTRAFSWALYPVRSGVSPPTQSVYG